MEIFFYHNIATYMNHMPCYPPEPYPCGIVCLTKEERSNVIGGGQLAMQSSHGDDEAMWKLQR